MTSIQPGLSQLNTSVANTAAKPAVQFSGNTTDNILGFFDDLIQGQETVADRLEKQADKASAKDGVKNAVGKSKEVTGNIVSRTMRGLKRVVTKSLRPRGLVELATIAFGGVGIIFPIKHFVEGFTGKSSIIFPRIFTVMHGHTKPLLFSLKK